MSDSTLVRQSRLAESAALASILAVAVVARLPNDPATLFWLDEAWRVRQALHGVVQGVLLLSEHVFARISYSVAGLNESAFRFWPLVGVLLAIVSAARLGRLLLRTPLWLWACLTYAIAQNFLMHTREFKPYGMDLGMTLATVAAAVSASRSERGSLRPFAAISILTAASTAVFPFVHAGTATFLATSGGGRFSRRQLAEAILLPTSVFVAVYFLYLRGQSGLESTTEYWKSLYLNSEANLRHIGDVAWASGEKYDLVGSQLLWPCAFILAPLVSLWRRDGVWALILVPLLVQAGFSAFGLYPLFDRPSFYFYGLAVFCVPYCGDALLSIILVKRYQILAAWLVLLAGGIWIFSSGRAEYHWQNGTSWPLQPDARVVFDTLRRDYDPSQPLYLNYGIADTFALYAPEVFAENAALRSYPASREAALQNRSMTQLCMKLILKCADLEAGQTVWFASAHTGYAGRYYEELLRRVGKVHLLVDERAACLVRVELTKPIRDLRPLCQQLWNQDSKRRAL